MRTGELRGPFKTPVELIDWWRHDFILNGVTSSSHGGSWVSLSVESPQSLRHRRSNCSFSPVRTVHRTVETSKCDAVSYRNLRLGTRSWYRKSSVRGPKLKFSSQQQNVADIRCICDVSERSLILLLISLQFPINQLIRKMIQSDLCGVSFSFLTSVTISPSNGGVKVIKMIPNSKRDAGRQTQQSFVISLIIDIFLILDHSTWTWTLTHKKVLINTHFLSFIMMETSWKYFQLALIKRWSEKGVCLIWWVRNGLKYSLRKDRISHLNALL